MRLLLFSNSTNAGEDYLSYTLEYIDEFLKEQPRNALFIPYAGISVGFDAYFTMVADKLGQIGIELSSIHTSSDKRKDVEKASIIIVGGGNTFYLLKSLQEEGLIEPIREAVLNGKSYIGWSAGSNMACPTICTTNDMPIVEPIDFNALGLISFQINPHYTDFIQKGHAGETREMRINEYLLANKDMYVAGLREGTLLQVENNSIQLKGAKSCRIFKYGQDAFEVSVEEDFDFLL
jgi:dipeptidase E